MKFDTLCLEGENNYIVHTYTQPILNPFSAAVTSSPGNNTAVYHSVTRLSYGCIIFEWS
jgi:hypothetical protein